MSDLAARFAHGSLDALRTALASRSKRAGRRVALIHEGGGMRGAFGAGVLTGLHQAGLRSDAFDALYGVSAGALNLMYWVSRRPHDSARIYSQEILRSTEPPFFLYRSRAHLFYRLARGRAVIDLSAVERMMDHVRPIDAIAVREHPTPIWFPITNAAKLTTEFVDARALLAADLVPTLIAAASVPALSDARSLADSAFIDGACGAPLPVGRAIAQGFTDLVVILNLPIAREPAWYEPVLLRLLATRRGLSPRLAALVRNARLARRAAMVQLTSPPRGVRVTLLAPPILPGGTLERAIHVIDGAIRDGTALGASAVRSARNGSAPRDLEDAPRVASER